MKPVDIDLDLGEVSMRISVYTVAVDEDIRSGSSHFQFEVAPGAFMVISSRWGTLSDHRLRQAVARLISLLAK